MYWLTSSLFTMVQVVTLKQPAVRQALGIPVAIKHDVVAPEQTKTNKGYWTLIKESKSPYNTILWGGGVILSLSLSRSYSLSLPPHSLHQTILSQ